MTCILACDQVKVSIQCIYSYLFLLTHVLTRNLITSAINWDKKDNLNKPPSKRASAHRDSLQAAITSCGVCFSIWEKKDADGSGSGSYDFTSLMGSDKKLLLRNLPEKLQGVIEPQTSDTVINIWKVPV